MKYNVITNENIIQFVDSNTGLLDFFYNKSEIDSLAIDNNIINIVVNGRSNVYNYNEDFENLNGNDTFNKDDLITSAIEGVGSIGIGGAGGSTVDTDHIFNDNTARDTYFTTNLSEIKSGLNILVGGVLQVWTDGNEPASYDNTYWHDYSTPLTGAEVKILYESNDNTEVLETSKKEILDKLSTNNEGNIVSSTSWIFPPNSIYIGNNAVISNALRGLNLTDPVLNKRGLLLAQIYDNSGSQKAFTYKIEAVSTVIANDTVGEVQNTAQFVRTPTNDEIIESFHIQTETSSNNTDVEIIVRLDSHTSENEIIRYTKQIQSDINGVVDVVLPNPIVTDANLDLYIEMNIIGMQGSQVGGGFVPKHTADIQILERDIIVNENDIIDFKNAAYGVDRNGSNIISINTDNTSVDIDEFSFYLNGTKHNIPSQTVDMNWQPTDKFAFIGVKADGTFEIIKNNSFSPNQSNSILELGGMCWNGTSISNIGNTYISYTNYLQNNYTRDKYFRGTSFSLNAGLVSENETTPRKLDVSNGFISTSTGRTIELSTIQNLDIYPVYNSTIQNLQSSFTLNDEYDNSGTLTNIPNNKFVNHTLLMNVCTRTFYLVYSKNVYDKLNDAKVQDVDKDLFQTILGAEMEVIASIIIEEGSTNITEIIDRRSSGLGSEVSSGVGLTVADIHNDYTRDAGEEKVISSTAVYNMYNFFLNPTWVEIDSNDSNITYGGFKTTGRIRRRDLTTGIDTFFQSAETLPIGSSTTWVDWGNRESLIYN